MIAMAKVLSDAEVKAAAEYFAALKPTPGYNKVVEADKVPKSYVGRGGMRFASPTAATSRSAAASSWCRRTSRARCCAIPKSGFIDYVPKGSIAKGAALMAGGDGKTIACPICHGPTLKGLGEVPGIAGRPATYIVPPAQRHEDRQSQRARGSS